MESILGDKFYYDWSLFGISIALELQKGHAKCQT